MATIPFGERASISSESSDMDGWMVHFADKSNAANDIDHRCHCCGRRRGATDANASPAGYLTGATNPAAAEWVHGRLMGFDPQKIPLVLGAFSSLVTL